MSEYYRIKEIFGPTIQGEGSYTGMPCLFVRFAGCNRNCSFCDTDWLDGQKMGAVEIGLQLKKLLKMSDDILPIVFTGGEPTIQLDIDLIEFLKSLGFNQFHMESNGLNDISDELWGLLDHITISPKQSLSETKLDAVGDVKVLYPYQPYIGSLDEFIEYYEENRNDFASFPTFYLQPIWGAELMKNIKEAQREIVRLKLKYPEHNIKLSLQTHKFTGAR